MWTFQLVNTVYCKSWGELRCRWECSFLHYCFKAVLVAGGRRRLVAPCNIGIQLSKRMEWAVHLAALFIRCLCFFHNQVQCVAFIVTMWIPSIDEGPVGQALTWRRGFIIFKWVCLLLLKSVYFVHCSFILFVVFCVLVCFCFTTLMCRK